MNPAQIPSICLIIALLALIIKWGSSNAEIRKLKDTLKNFNEQIADFSNLNLAKTAESQELGKRVSELSNALEQKDLMLKDTMKSFTEQIKDFNALIIDKTAESQELGQKVSELNNAFEQKDLLFANLSQEHEVQTEKIKESKYVNQQLTELINQFKEKTNDFELLQRDYLEQAKLIQGLKEKYDGIINLENELGKKDSDLNNLNSALQQLNDRYLAALEIYNSLDKEISLYRSEIEVMDYGLYQPQFDYATSEEYQQHIESNYLKQKAMISNDTAATCPTEWTVNGNKTEGKRMTKLNKKNMLYAFNGECDALIAKVKWNNATKSIERLEKAYETINRLGNVNNVTLSYEYFQLKKEELKLAYEFENKKQEEKDEQRRIREQMREEDKVQRDIDRAQREAEEDERRYQRALTRVKEDLRYASKDELEELNEKLFELKQKLKEAEEKKQRALSMAQLTRAGHIYIISNIGSFGVDIYKIGMTRRLEPLDRVRELSDASVPFRYDVHAVVYSEDAPKLEYDLHKKFNDRRINRVNGRKEFFKVSLDEIENFVKEHADAKIEFTQLAEAREYRETMLMIDALLKVNDELDEGVKAAKFPPTLI